MSNNLLPSNSTILNLQDLVGSEIRSQATNHVGKVIDLIARLAVEGYPPTTGMLVLYDRHQIFIPMKLVTGIESVTGAERRGLTVINERDLANFDPFKRRTGEVLLKRDILGRKLIYLGEHTKPRLIKAAEIDIANIEGSWRVVGIEARKHRRLFRRHIDQEGDHVGFVDWSHLEPFLAHVPTSRLRVSYRKLAKVHPSELADLVESASPEEGQEIIAAVGEDRELEADVFEELDDEHQLELVARRTDAQVASLLATMAPDDAVDLLSEIEQERRQPILKLMPFSQQMKVRSLLGYNAETAGGLMNPAVISIGDGQTAKNAIERIRRGDEPYETACTVYVVSEDGTLTGSFNIVELLRADPDRPVSDIAHADPPHVTTNSDLPDIATIMADYNLTAVPVVDANFTLVGQVTVDDLLEQLVPENWKRRSELL